MTHHALETVHLIQEATHEAETMARSYPHAMVDVLVSRPTTVNCDDLAWVTLAVLFRQPHESPMEAGARLAKYLQAYQETYGTTPSLTAIRAHAATRKAQEGPTQPG